MRDALTRWPATFADEPGERDAVLRLSHVTSASPREMLELARREGRASRCLAGARGASGERARAVDVEQVRAAMRRAGARLVLSTDEEYPDALRDLSDPPGWLFVRGRALSGAGMAVAMVGARNATPYGREAAVSIAARIASAGVTVVSGAARGIDAASHRGALESGGTTVAVLGSGIDVAYPASSRHLLRRIASEGTIVSEYPPGTPARPMRFPARNRIVASLARAVVVVEGAEGSGSLITAGFAEDLGRSVLAVPGPIDNPLSLAPHELIRDGARIVCEPDDVLREIGLIPEGGSDAEPVGLDPDERAVWRTLTGAPATLEAVGAAARLPPSRAVVAVSMLELRGLASCEGGRYRRAPQKRREAQTSGDPRNAASAASAETS